MATTNAVFKSSKRNAEPLDITQSLTTADIIRYTVPTGGPFVTGAPQSNTLAEGAEALLSPLAPIAANTLTDPMTIADVLLFTEVSESEAVSQLEIVRYTADGAIQDKDHRAIFETGAVNMTLAASTENRLIQMVSEGPATVITANGAEEFTSSGGTSTDQKLTINETFRWATILGRTAGGWSQYVGQVGLPAGVVESTPTKFQAGTRLVQNGVDAASGVTFPEAFKVGTIPTIKIIAEDTGDNVNVTLQTVTNTGFTSWVVRNESDVGIGAPTIHWEATGEVA